MISVLMPSRKRPQMALESILSLGEGDLEILVLLDNDDELLDLYVESLEEISNVKVFIEDRLPYDRVHDRYNFFLPHTTKNWYLVWNDDALMVSKDWLTTFSYFTAENRLDPILDPIVVNIWYSKDAGHNVFPLVSRRYCDILGHFSLHTAIDSYIGNVASKAGINYNLRGIKPIHKRRTFEDDSTRELEKSRNDSLGKAWGFFHEETTALINNDAKKIIESMGVV